MGVVLGKRWACECAHHQPRPQDLSLGRVLASSSRSPSLSCLSRILFVSLRVPVSLSVSVPGSPSPTVSPSLLLSLNLRFSFLSLHVSVSCSFSLVSFSTHLFVSPLLFPSLCVSLAFCLYHTVLLSPHPHLIFHNLPPAPLPPSLHLIPWCVQGCPPLPWQGPSSPTPSYHSLDRDKVYLEVGGYESSLSAAPLE